MIADFDKSNEGEVTMARFELVSEYEPKGDQPQAIVQLVERIRNNEKYLTLLGATGTGKTFTMAHTIAQVNKPTLILAHNKTLAAQLCSEFKEFFPNNAVEYFVSYYDYYQPEAYGPLPAIRISKKMPASTMKLINCAIRQPARCWNGTM